MNTQALLDFELPPAPPSEVECLVFFLFSHPGFHTARQLETALELSDRKVRQLAEASAGWIVSGPGSPGYCHLDHCPVEKVDHIASKLISQGKAMIRRAIKIRRKAHARIR